MMASPVAPLRSLIALANCTFMVVSALCMCSIARPASCTCRSRSRQAGRRGKKRALVAVGHSILVILCHMLKKDTTYAELGADFLDRLQPERKTRYYVQRLQALGHKVTLEPCNV